MLCWEPSRKLFWGVRDFFFCESFAKVGYYESLSLYTARGSGRRMVPHICLPFIGSSQVSEDEASPQPNTMVLKHILAPAAGTAWCCFLKSEETRSKRSSQASKGEAFFARAKHQGPWCLFSLWCAPCWWLGSADRGIFAKVPRKFCERVGESMWKSKCILKGVA